MISLGRIIVPLWTCLLTASPISAAQDGAPSIPSNPAMTVNYTDPYDNTSMMGYSVVKSDDSTSTTSKPIVIILPDWDGVNTYEIERAQMLAELGWVAFAADVYGIEEHQPESFQDRVALVTRYRNDLELMNARVAAAIEAASMIEGADMSKGVALIGYCFGGSVALSHALSGQTGADAAIAFHGGIGSVNKDLNTTVNSKVLILSGGKDTSDSTADMKAMEEALNRGDNLWQISRYSNVEHGFTNFHEMAYNAHVDARSWYACITFIQEVFGEVVLVADVPEGIAGTSVEYEDPADGTSLVGFLSYPLVTEEDTKVPAVIIVHDLDGIGEYEQKRAQMLNEMGYVAFAADVYGTVLKDATDFANLTQAFGLVNYYRDDIDMFVGRIKAAVELVAADPKVDAERIALIGYCFGGTGVINYALTGESGAKAIVSFHGGLSKRAPVGEKIHTRMMIQSGGDDDVSSDIEDLENAMENGTAPFWEYTRYQGVVHSFTDWSAGDEKYNLRADVTSWDAMGSFLESTFMEEETAGSIAPTLSPVKVETAATIAPTLSPVVAAVTAPPTLSPVDVAMTKTIEPTLSPVIPATTKTTEPTLSPVVTTETKTLEPTLSPVDAVMTKTNEPTLSPVVATETKTIAPTLSPVDAAVTMTNEPTLSPVVMDDSSASKIPLVFLSVFSILLCTII